MLSWGRKHGNRTPESCRWPGESHFSSSMARADSVPPSDANLGMLVTQSIVTPWLEAHPDPRQAARGSVCVCMYMYMSVCLWQWGVGCCYTIITAGQNNKLAPN